MGRRPDAAFCPPSFLALVLPLACYACTIGAYLAFATQRNPIWFRIGLSLNVAAVVIALLAATPALLQWLLSGERRAGGRAPRCATLWLRLAGLAMFTTIVWVEDGFWDVPPSSISLGILLGAAGFAFALWAAGTEITPWVIGRFSVPAPLREARPMAPEPTPIGFGAAFLSPVHALGEASEDSGELRRAA